MRKITSILLALVMLVSVCSVTALAETAAPVKAEVSGSATTLTVTITAAELLTNGKIEITYPAGVTFRSCEMNTAVWDKSAGKGKLTLGFAVSALRPIQPQEVIGTVTFSGTYGATVELTLKVVEYNDKDAQELSVPLRYTFPKAPGGTTPPSGGVQGDGDANPGVTTPQFVDVAPDHWARAAVDYVAEKGYFKGTDAEHFAPQVTMDRAMFVTVLGRLAGVEESAYNATQFNDVEQGSWYAGYAAWGQESGVIQGYSETSFGPHDPVTREQMALLFFRYAEYAGLDTGVQEDALAGFTDAGQIHDWALEAVKWAVSHNILRGDGTGLLMPTGSATRAQVAQVVLNFDQNMGR